MDSSLLNWEVRVSLPYPVLHNSIRARIGSLRVLLVVNCACGCEEVFGSKEQNGDGMLFYLSFTTCPSVIQSLFKPLIDLLYTEADTAMDDLLLYTNPDSAVESLFSFHPKYPSSLVSQGL